jgi:L-rhamnose mutarotase
LGGSGSIPGVVIAAFVMGLVTFGLGLLNVPGIVMSIVIGALLIGVIALPRLWEMWRAVMEKYRLQDAPEPGCRTEYIKRHDEIWPELVTLLKDAGVSDYSIHLDEETNILFGVLWRRDDHDGRSADPPDHAEWWAHMADIMETHPDNEPVVTESHDRLSHAMTRRRATSPSSTSARPTPSWRWSTCRSVRIAVVTRPTSCCRARPGRISMSRGTGPSCWMACADFHAGHGVDAISITTHGASVALLDAGRVACRADPRLRARRPDERSPQPMMRSGRPLPRPGRRGSPAGSISGRSFTGSSRSIRPCARAPPPVVTYPQFWAHRLTGVPATDVTSLGCHTDLWNPIRRHGSLLADSAGHRGRSPAAQAVGRYPGPRSCPSIAADRTAPDTPVYCGIHDSNASLLAASCLALRRLSAWSRRAPG